VVARWSSRRQPRSTAILDALRRAILQGLRTLRLRAAMILGRSESSRLIAQRIGNDRLFEPRRIAAARKRRIRIRAPLGGADEAVSGINTSQSSAE